jgi:integrase
LNVPRPRLPYLHRQLSRLGETIWYVRIGHGPRTRIKGVYGTAAFTKHYQDAVSGNKVETAPGSTRAASLRWLWDRYRETQPWAKLSNATRRQRENIMRGVLQTAGNDPFKGIDRKTIVEGRDRRSATPAMARHFVDTMRGLFLWALAAEHVKADPTHGVETDKRQTEGFRVWSDDERAQFRAFYALGTRERLAFDLLAYTGLRRGDVVNVGRQHCKNNVLTLRTEKTGEIVSIRILPSLAESIAAGPTGDLAFIVGERSGLPMTKESFGNWFRDACARAGCPGSAHGLRKAFATDLAHNGASEKQMDAVMGWRGGGMAALYTRAASRQRLAADAMSKFEEDER